MSNGVKISKVEVDKEEAEEILAIERHKANMKSQKEIIDLLKNNDNSEVVKAIENQSKIIEKFTESIKEISKNPEINVEVNQHEVIKIVKEVGKMIMEGQSKVFDQIVILNLPREATFSFRRDNGLIESPIKVTTNIIKPKAQA